MVKILVDCQKVTCNSTKCDQNIVSLESDGVNTVIKAGSHEISLPADVYEKAEEIVLAKFKNFDPEKNIYFPGSGASGVSFQFYDNAVCGDGSSSDKFLLTLWQYARKKSGATKIEEYKSGLLKKFNDDAGMVDGYIKASLIETWKGALSSSIYWNDFKNINSSNPESGLKTFTQTLSLMTGFSAEQGGIFDPELINQEVKSLVYKSNLIKAGWKYIKEKFPVDDPGSKKYGEYENFVNFLNKYSHKSQIVGLKKGFVEKWINKLSNTVIAFDIEDLKLSDYGLVYKQIAEIVFNNLNKVLPFNVEDVPPQMLDGMVDELAVKAFDHPKNLKGWDLQKLDTARNVSYLTDKEKDVILTLNMIRSNPPLFAKQFLVKIKDLGDYYSDCYSEMLKTKPLPILKPSLVLSKSARDHSKDIGVTGATGHDGTDGSTLANRIERYGEWEGTSSENIYYGPDKSGFNMAVALLVDKDVADRGHRKTILNPAFNYIGVAIFGHKLYQYNMVQDFASKVTN